MGEAAAQLDWVFPDPPVVKLKLIRGRGPEHLTEADGALLDVLEATFIRRWVDALSTVEPARAAATAERLWRETSSAWKIFSPKVTRLLRDAGSLDERSSEEDAVFNALSGALPSALDYLPNLSPTAKVYARAFLGLLGSSLRDSRADAEGRETIEGALAGRWPTDQRLDDYRALLHGFSIAGLEAQIPEPVVNALAPAFWARMRAFAEGDDDFRTRMDRALREALSEANGGPRAVGDAAVAIEPKRQSALTRLRRQADASPGNWASVPPDASQNLDKYLYGR